MASYAGKLTGTQTGNVAAAIGKRRYAKVNEHTNPDDGSSSYAPYDELGHVFNHEPYPGDSSPYTLATKCRWWNEKYKALYSVEFSGRDMRIVYNDGRQTAVHRLDIDIGAVMFAPDIYGKKIYVIVWHADDIHFSVVGLDGKILVTNTLPATEPGYTWTSVSYCQYAMADQLKAGQPLTPTLRFTAVGKNQDGETCAFTGNVLLPTNNAE